jgi:hypothetical protein
LAYVLSRSKPAQAIERLICGKWQGFRTPPERRSKYPKTDEKRLINFDFLRAND